MIQRLLRQCDSKSEGLRINALTPVHHCLHTPGGPLQFSLEAHPFAPFGIDLTSDGKYLVSVSSIMVIWHLASGDIFRQVYSNLDNGVYITILQAGSCTCFRVVFSLDSDGTI